MSKMSDTDRPYGRAAGSFGDHLGWLEHFIMSTTARCLFLAVSILIASSVLDKIFASYAASRKLGIPVLNRPKGVRRWDYPDILTEGAKLYPNTPYITSYSGYDFIIYPSSSFDDIKRLPATQASMVDWYTHVFFQGWRFLAHPSSGLPTVVGVDLMRALPALSWERQQHAQLAFESIIGSCEEWKTLPLMWTTLELMTMTNAISLVGKELGTNRSWLTSVKRFPIAIMMAVLASHSMPFLIRPLVSMLAFAPAWGLYWNMRRLLRPNIAPDSTHQHTSNEGKPAASAGRFPITQWLKARHDTSPSYAQLAHDYIVASFESSGAMGGTLYFLMAELIMRPNLFEELREEVSMFMVDGRLPKSHLAELRKVDSFMRETARVNPFNYLTLFRRTQQPCQFSVGPELPAGSLICVDAYNITTSKALWGNPETFDPARFLKLREQPGHENLHQFTTLGSDSPGWGAGPQACPGRVFAGTTLKIVLAHLLMNYEIKVHPQTGRPKRVSMPSGNFGPDLWAKIMIRKRPR